MSYRGRRGRRSRFSRLRTVAGLWVLSFFIVFFANAAYPIPQYVWLIPLLLVLYIGSVLGYRVAQYALRAGRYGVESIWKTRVLMTVGLLATVGFLFLFLLSALLAALSVPIASTESYQLATQLESNFIYTVVLFLLPIAMGFLAGESYLIYRLRHHYTIGRSY